MGHLSALIGGSDNEKLKGGNNDARQSHPRDVTRKNWYNR